VAAISLEEASFTVLTALPAKKIAGKTERTGRKKLRD
jgi:hypothetical protein